MKGIILAGGSGTRLRPLTLAFSKQLLPIYDKPMVYYPLSVLMLAGIRDILIITTPEDQQLFIKLLGNGASFGVNLTYKTQDSPNGIAEAFIIGEKFIGDSSVSLVLGDNIFYGHRFAEMLLTSTNLTEGAIISTTIVQNPEQFGVAELDAEGDLISIEEKPENPKSNLAITGLYFYDNAVIDIAKSLTPSKRGELEITAVNQEYLRRGTLRINELGRGFSWLDTGTHEALVAAGEFVHTIEKRQGLKIACLEEIALNNQWISKHDVAIQALKYANTEYGAYLQKLSS